MDACAIRQAVLARSSWMMCSACCKVSVGVVRCVALCRDLSGLMEFRAPCSFRKGLCYPRPGFIAFANQCADHLI